MIHLEPDNCGNYIKPMLCTSFGSYQSGYDRGYRTCNGEWEAAMILIHREIAKLDWRGDDAFWDGVSAVEEIIENYVQAYKLAKEAEK